mmetsp:Transcript_27565/g.81028  ORF Transcript_27565/g.81028 Transcript_27565/m.81028 type:complete len:337 (+) Transcript_27565:607-1617(+)
MSAAQSAGSIGRVPLAAAEPGSWTCMSTMSWTCMSVPSASSASMPLEIARRQCRSCAGIRVSSWRFFGMTSSASRVMLPSLFLQSSSTEQSGRCSVDSKRSVTWGARRAGTQAMISASSPSTSLLPPTRMTASETVAGRPAASRVSVASARPDVNWISSASWPSTDTCTPALRTVMATKCQLSSPAIRDVVHQPEGSVWPALATRTSTRPRASMPSSSGGTGAPTWSSTKNVCEDLALGILSHIVNVRSAAGNLTALKVFGWRGRASTEHAGPTAKTVFWRGRRMSAGWVSARTAMAGCMASAISSMQSARAVTPMRVLSVERESAAQRGGMVRAR